MVFKFRLERILSIRRQAVEKARLRVIAAEKALKEAKEKVSRLQIELKTAHEEMIADHYRMAQDYLRLIKSIEKKLDQARKDVKQREIELAERKRELLDAQKRLEALEKLKIKQAEEYKLESDRLEQKQTDEKVTMKFAHDALKNQEDIEEEIFA